MTSASRSTLRGWLFATAMVWCVAPAAGAMQLVETSIDDIHEAIQSGQTTCRQVVEGFIARARAYNGICTQLVTEDGRKIVKVSGATRAGAAI
jgi:Asp-tRNA(Asn)/Glu-tRNA(Gln) amidotransferase A subunit family amidase